MTMLDFDQLYDRPAWADECEYVCKRTPTSELREELHFSQHIPVTCEYCGHVSPNRFVHDLNHAPLVNAFADMVVCTTVFLLLNHWVSEVRRGEPVNARSQELAEQGWVLNDDETFTSPPGFGGAS